MRAESRFLRNFLDTGKKEWYSFHWKCDDEAQYHSYLCSESPRSVRGGESVVRIPL